MLLKLCYVTRSTVRSLRTLLNGEPPQNIFNAKEYGDEAMRAGIHSTLDSSSGSLTINRDILLNIPLIADWHAITQRR